MTRQSAKTAYSDHLDNLGSSKPSRLPSNPRPQCTKHREGHSPRAQMTATETEGQDDVTEEERVGVAQWKVAEKRRRHCLELLLRIIAPDCYPAHVLHTLRTAASAQRWRRGSHRIKSASHH